MSRYVGGVLPQLPVNKAIPCKIHVKIGLDRHLGEITDVGFVGSSGVVECRREKGDSFRTKKSSLQLGYSRRIIQIEKFCTPFWADEYDFGA
jgi:hypothetical protein